MDEINNFNISLLHTASFLYCTPSLPSLSTGLTTHTHTFLPSFSTTHTLPFYLLHTHIIILFSKAKNHRIEKKGILPSSSCNDVEKLGSCNASLLAMLRCINEWGFPCADFLPHNCNVMLQRESPSQRPQADLLQCNDNVEGSPSSTMPRCSNVVSFLTWISFNAMPHCSNMPSMQVFFLLQQQW